MRVAAILLAAVAMRGQAIVPFSGLPENTSEVAVSPDGKTLAYSVDGDIRVRPAAGGAETIFVKESDQADRIPGNLVWSPDGLRIAFTYESCHHCDDLLAVKAFPNGPAIDLGASCKAAPSWTPNGKYLIVAAPRGDEECRIDLVPADGSTRTPLVSHEGDRVAVSPEGKRLVYAAGNALKLAILDSDFRISGTPRVIAQEPHAISSIYWTADGHSVVYHVWNGGYTRWLTVDGAPVSRLLDPGTNFSISQILSDGSAVGTENGQKHSLWRIDLRDAAAKPEKIRELAWTDHNIAVSPDGSSIAFETNRNGPSQIWVTNFDGTNPRVLVASIPPFDQEGDNTVVDGISWSPDGQWIAMETSPGVGHGDSDAHLYVVSATGGVLRELVRECSMMMYGPPWSADSKYLYIDQEDHAPDPDPSYSRVEVATGKLTPVEPQELLKNPRTSSPFKSYVEQPHVAQGGRYLYYVDIGEYKNRLVMIRDFVK